MPVVRRSRSTILCYHGVMKRATPVYIVQTQPGFAPIATEEILATVDATIHETYTLPQKNDLLFFSTDDDPQLLLALRTAEDLFVEVAHIKDLPLGYSALKAITEAALRAPGFDTTIGVHRRARPERAGEGKLRFRVVARQEGQAAYRRVDGQEALQKGILLRQDHRWRLDDGGMEYWLTLLPTEALVMLRLSDATMRHRTYQREHRAASLRPASAAALSWLTEPNDDDTFLDPMCGAGTLVIERANLGRYAQLIGSDIDMQAVELARANVGTRFQPIAIDMWDAADLPLDAGSVSALAVNLPFGTQFGSREDNRTLYPAFLAEAARVMRPGAQLVALTGDVRGFTEALRRQPQFFQRNTWDVQILGHGARIFRLRHH